MNTGSTLLNREDLKKIKALKNSRIEQLISTYIDLCTPFSVRVITDSPEDSEYLRSVSRQRREETPLEISGHTVHFDGYYDQGRDTEHTRILITADMHSDPAINSMSREDGLNEITPLMKGIMSGKEMFVLLFIIGPHNSDFSIPALQITDSAYVAHSSDILYRNGYSDFKRFGDSAGFFTFIHSAGALNEQGVSINTDKRRIYVDLLSNTVFTINNQYAGNSIGMKKLAHRLAIKKASEEGWLAEHMFIMGATPPDKTRITYFTGAFPSGCGKTSTAMIPGQRIVGDDIAYIRENYSGLPHAVNIEQGMFGIIENINPGDDPLLYKTITTQRELIFSNILINNGKPYWLGMGSKIPDNGFNYAGKWQTGDRDAEGKEIPFANKNARFLLRLRELENYDPQMDNPDGVPLSGIIYGGRDSDTTVPVCQCFDWNHGVFTGLTLESETTAATLGQAGIRKSNPMANMDFIVIPLVNYIRNHIDFGRRQRKLPLVFAVNYFLKDNGEFINSKLDKKVWLM
jgi:phosphoenolpyruvate carboxykinase (GTP)